MMEWICTSSADDGHVEDCVHLLTHSCSNTKILPVNPINGSFSSELVYSRYNTTSSKTYPRKHFGLARDSRDTRRSLMAIESCDVEPAGGLFYPFAVVNGIVILLLLCLFVHALYHEYHQRDHMLMRLLYVMMLIMSIVWATIFLFAEVAKFIK